MTTQTRMFDFILPRQGALALAGTLMIFCATLLLSENAAATAKRLTVLVSVDDKLPKNLAKLVVSSAEDEVQQMGKFAWRPAPKFKRKKYLALLKCIKADAECLRKTTAKLGVDDLVFVHLQRKAKSKTVITLYYSRKVYSLQARSLSVQLPDNRVQSEMLIKYLTRRFLRGESPALILIDTATHSMPLAVLPSSGYEACKLFIDGQPVPMYDRQQVLKIGKHRLRIEMADYKTVERDIEIKAGQAFLWSTELSWLLPEQQAKKTKPSLASNKSARPKSINKQAAAKTQNTNAQTTAKATMTHSTKTGPAVVEQSALDDRGPSTLKLAGWSAVGLGVALLGSGAGLFAWYSSIVNELNQAAIQQNTQGHVDLLTQTDYDDKANFAPTLNIVALATLATGGLMGTAGLLMLLIDDTQE